jgi:hypothetical protein
MWIFIFLISGLYALFHFVWQSTIAPSLRLDVRFRVFALRDELRRLKLADQPVSDDAFHIVEEMLIAVLHVLYEIDVPLLIHCDWYANTDQKFKEQIQKRMEIVKSANCPELEKIVVQARKQLVRAAKINSGGWMPYVIPSVMTLLFFKTLCKPIFSVIYMNRAQLQKIIPEREDGLVPA